MRWMDLEEGDVVDIGFASEEDANLRLITKSKKSSLGGEIQEIDMLNLSTGKLSSHTRRRDDDVTAWYAVLRGPNLVQEAEGLE